MLAAATAVRAIASGGSAIAKMAVGMGAHCRYQRAETGTVMGPVSAYRRVVDMAAGRQDGPGEQVAIPLFGGAVKQGKAHS